MKFQGVNYQLRGSNKKYPQLDDLDLLFEELKKKSITKLAKELGVPQNSIRYRVFRYFPAEWLKVVRRDRRYHSRKIGKRKPAASS